MGWFENVEKRRNQWKTLEHFKNNEKIYTHKKTMGILQKKHLTKNRNILTNHWDLLET